MSGYTAIDKTDHKSDVFHRKHIFPGIGTHLPKYYRKKNFVINQSH